jgi:hypothetical protein
MKLLSTACLLLVCFLLQAQLPETEIFLAKIEIKNNLLKIQKAENVTNHNGYDNQPFFTPDGKTLLYSAQTDADQRIHLFALNLKSKKSAQLTHTNTSEYSPMLSPQGNAVSAVVVEEDSTQRIWLYDAKNGERKSCLTEAIDSIGYYCWLGRDSLAYYKLTDPHSLRALDLKSGTDNWLCDHPTRSFRRIDARTLLYVINEEKQNLVMLYDIRVKKATVFATDLPANQDYTWLAGLGLLKSEGSKIFRYSPETKVWVELADFASAGIKKITRFAFSTNQKLLALVSNTD